MAKTFKCIRDRVLQAFDSYSELRLQQWMAVEELERLDQLEDATVRLVDELRETLEEIFARKRRRVQELRTAKVDEDKILDALATALTWTVNADHPAVLAYIVNNLDSEAQREMISSLSDEARDVLRHLLSG